MAGGERVVVGVVHRASVVTSLQGGLLDRVGMEGGLLDRVGLEGSLLDRVGLEGSLGQGKGSGAGLVGPGVVGEALGGNEVLAGGEMVAIHVAPARPRAVHCLAVALQVQKLSSHALGEHDVGKAIFRKVHQYVGRGISPGQPRRRHGR